MSGKAPAVAPVPAPDTFALVPDELLEQALSAKVTSASAKLAKTNRAECPKFRDETAMLVSAR